MAYELDNYNINMKSDTDDSSFKASYINGILQLPAEVVRRLGIEDGAELRINMLKDRVELLPNIHSLSKVYIEPTSRCNLMCHTCIRNTWKESMGEMDIKVFDKLTEELRAFKHIESVMFGGFGEPSFHKDILYMIGRVKSLGIEVEMVTNGTLLNEQMMEGFIENGLDKLWVSFDGTSRDSFDDIRMGANFDRVVENLVLLKRLNQKSEHKVKVGIAFVAMKQNIDDLRNIGKLARRVGAKEVSISNVIPYEKDMQQQALYERTLGEDPMGVYRGDIKISLPKLDINDMTRQTIYEISRNNDMYLMRNRIGIDNRTCRFIKERCTFIRWDGMVSPCMGLLHSYKTYLNNYERSVEAYTIGNIKDLSLLDIWNSDEYREFRERVDEFDFSPCHACGGCNYIESNKEDCFGNKFPCCGGCLWAQGIIQCP